LRYLLDTDHLSLIQRPAGEAGRKVATRLASFASTDIAISVISLHEQLMGVNNYIQKARRTDEVVRGYGMFHQLLSVYSKAEVLPFGEQAAEIFERFRKQGNRAGTMDLRIAAIAMSTNRILVTRNIRHFESLPGLRLENWAD